MLIDKKEKYTLISADEKSFLEFYDKLNSKISDFNKEHLIVEVSNIFNITKENISLFLSVAHQKKENGTSFVVIKKDINIDDFPEDFNIVPTLIEAEDILDMEAMERELGF